VTKEITYNTHLIYANKISVKYKPAVATYYVGYIFAIKQFAADRRPLHWADIHLLLELPWLHARTK